MMEEPKVQKPVKKNGPVWKDKVGNVHLALFKNKNAKGKKYVIWALTTYKFPFSYSKTLYFTETEAKSILEVLQKRPEIKRK